MGLMDRFFGRIDNPDRDKKERLDTQTTNISKVRVNEDYKIIPTVESLANKEFPSNKEAIAAHLEQVQTLVGEGSIIYTNSLNKLRETTTDFQKKLDAILSISRRATREQTKRIEWDLRSAIEGIKDQLTDLDKTLTPYRAYGTNPSSYAAEPFQFGEVYLANPEKKTPAPTALLQDIGSNPVPYNIETEAATRATALLQQASQLQGAVKTLYDDLATFLPGAGGSRVDIYNTAEVRNLMTQKARAMALPND